MVIVDIVTRISGDVIDREKKYLRLLKPTGIKI